ncbi:WAT1-related protein At1g25270-like [Euphorbia lathyris]|uniref:WAT1-related protein At1g25270-like n=1 Tax=Euphorbia lathyris TaxID=212925 RepID=UPI00331365BA
MRHVIEVLHGLRPVILMILVQIIYTGMNVFYKLAANDGMNMRILVAYRWIFASAFTIPLALFIERKNRPNFSWGLLWLAFLSGLFGGTLSQNLYVESLIVTSATFAAAIANLTPAVTLILAVFLGYEKLGLKTGVGKAKTLGTLIGIGGAMLITLYRGVELKLWSTNVHLLKAKASAQNGHVSSNYIVGFVTAFGSCVCYAVWLMIQTKMSKIYPLHYTNAALTSIMASIQCVVFSVCSQRNWSHWKLGWNVRLLTVFYSGIINSGLVLTFIAWCVYMRGAVFVASFSPLSLVLIAIIASLLLQEQLHLGSVVGAALIVCGLYMVLWGQCKEMKEKAKLVPTQNENELIDIQVVSDSSLSKKHQHS